MSDVENECVKCGSLLSLDIPTVECGSNCHECGRYCHRANQPAYLYLLTHQQLMLHKIGIGTVGKDKGRLQHFIHEGWTVHGLWHGADKRTTFQWEKAVFAQLKAEFSSAGPDTPGFVGRSDRHWVESVSGKAISVTALAQLILTIVS